MSLRRVEIGEDGAPIFSPFAYTARPVVDGPELREDFDIYAELTERCFWMPPTSPMLLFAGDVGVALFLRRAATLEQWWMFHHAFLANHLQFGKRFDMAAEALSARAVPFKNGKTPRLSFAQVVFGCALLAMLPRDVRLQLEVPLSGGRSRVRPDYELTSQDGRQIRFEVNGMLSRTRGPVTEDGYHYLQRQPARLEQYAAAGCPAPLCVYADDLFDAGRLRTVISEGWRQLGLPAPFS